MSEITLNLSDYKSSGVYFLEIDNTLTEATSANAIRLAVGFNANGPFNRPVYLAGTDDCDELLGDISRKLERKGCFTNRNIRTMVKKAPVYALNLLNANTVDSDSNPDIVGFNAVSFDINSTNTPGTALFADMFDRSKFWVADENALMEAVSRSKAVNAPDKLHAPLFSIGNCGTKDISVIIRKAENLSGYSVTFLDWYGSKDAIPYKWINPYDYVSDYFVQVIAIKGSWSQSQYASYAADSVWSEYFTQDGIRKEKLNKFLRLDAVTVLGSWTGCIIPDFYDKQGKSKSISYLINKSCNKTGLLFGTNDEALDSLTIGKVSDTYPLNDASTKLGFYLDIDGDGNQTWEDSDVEKVTDEVAKYVVDMVGHTIDCSSNFNDIDFLSYNIKSSEVSNNIYRIPAVWNSKNPCQFSVKKVDLVNGGSGDTDLEIQVGDFVKNEDGFLTKVVKKQYKVDPTDGAMYTFTVLETPHLYTNTMQNYQVLNSPDIPDADDGAPETPEIYQNYQVLAAFDENVDGEVQLDGSVTKRGYAEIHRQLTAMYNTLKFIPLSGLRITNRHLPGFDAEGNPDVEAGVEKIYSMLEDEGIRRGLLNTEMIDYRYIIDTMSYGLGNECKAKKYLTRLAMDRGHCTAICNMPSMSQFASSDVPFFGTTYFKGEEPRPMFNVEYIPMGGNQDMEYGSDAELFSLPSEGNGAKYAGFFAPFLKYKEGTRTILVPPAADVSNVFINKFMGGDPYKTPANLQGVINNEDIVGVEYMFDTKDRDALEPFGVNPIISRNGTIMIYGDRTAYQTLLSDFNYLHVRELLNTIELKCKEVLDDYVFTYNLATTRSEIVTRLNPILQAMQDSNALVKFEIQVDDVNNTKEIIDEKFCIVDIGVWITQNMEKIVTRITLNKSGEVA